MRGTGFTWGEPFLTALRNRGFQTIVFDHRGTGGSDRVEQPFALVELASDAAALLEAIGVEQAHVLRVSMGGMVAQELALGHPERVRTLALGCTYAGGPGSALTAPEDFRMLGVAMASGDRESALRAAWELNVSRQFAATEDRYATFRQMAGRAPLAVAVIQLQLRAIAGTTRARAWTGSPPPPSSSTARRTGCCRRATRRRSPGRSRARLVLLDGVRHMFWCEQPARSAGLLAGHALSAQARGADR